MEKAWLSTLLVSLVLFSVALGQGGNNGGGNNFGNSNNNAASSWFDFGNTDDSSPAGYGGMMGQMMNQMIGKWMEWMQNKANEPLPDPSVCRSMKVRLEDICVGDFLREDLRWFFNSSSNQCQPFWGCKADTPGNNFATAEGCGKVCGVNVTASLGDMMGGLWGNNNNNRMPGKNGNTMMGGMMGQNWWSNINNNNNNNNNRQPAQNQQNRGVSSVAQRFV